MSRVSKSYAVGLLTLLVLLSTSAAFAAPALRTTFESAVLQEERPLNIVLPLDYSEDRTYPVVYALDGDSTYITTLARQMHAARADLILVGIENVDRSRDMFPDPVEARRNRGGGGRIFYRFLVDELVPYIEAEYSTNGFRVLSGQSNSAFFVLYALQRNYKAFDGYLALSPMIGWDWPTVRDDFTELLEDKRVGGVSLFLNEGGTDPERVTEFMPRFTELLDRMAPVGFRWKHVSGPDAEHVPVSGYAQGIEFIFGGE